MNLEDKIKFIIKKVSLIDYKIIKNALNKKPKKNSNIIKAYRKYKKYIEEE